MDLNTYLSQPIENRIEIATQPENLKTDSFWLGQLKNALINHSPTSCIIDKRLVDEYWTLLKFKNQLK